jgi:hypothetical protein
VTTPAVPYKEGDHRDFDRERKEALIEGLSGNYCGPHCGRRPELLDSWHCMPCHDQRNPRLAPPIRKEPR